MVSFYVDVCRLLSEVFFPIPSSSRIVRNSGSDLLSRRDISIKLLSCDILKMFCLFSNLFLVNSKLFCFLRSLFETYGRTR